MMIMIVLCLKKYCDKYTTVFKKNIVHTKLSLVLCFSQTTWFEKNHFHMHPRAMHFSFSPIRNAYYASEVLTGVYIIIVPK